MPSALPSVFADAAQTLSASLSGKAQPIDGPPEPAILKEGDHIGNIEEEHRRNLVDGGPPVGVQVARCRDGALVWVSWS